MQHLESHHKVWKHVRCTGQPGSVKALLVRWATGNRLTNRLPKLSLITLSPPLNSGCGLLSNWQRAGPRSLAPFRRGSLPVRMPWKIIPSGSQAPKMVQRRYRGVRLLRAERCCEMRSARLAKSQHAGLARSEQVWLLRLGSLLCWVAVSYTHLTLPTKA